MKLSVFTLIYVSAVACLIFQSFLYFKRNEINSIIVSKANAIKILITMMVSGFLLRILLFAAIKGYDSDLSCFIAWGNQVINDGLSNFYTAAGHEWYDYPPGYMLVLGAIAFIVKCLHLNTYSFLGRFIYLLPAIITDMASAYFVYRITNKENDRSFGLLMAAFVIFNPAIFFLSGAWGQIDSILTFLLLLTFYNAYKENYYLMGIFYGLAISTKWQALILGPVLLICLICFHDYKSKNENKKILKMLCSGLIAISIIGVLSLLFKGNQDLFWIIKRFSNSTLGYNYATIEAYNFMAAFRGNWVNADNAFILGLSYKFFGSAMIILTTIATIIACIRDRKFFKDDKEGLRRRIFMHATFYLFSVYTFGHYMHERYIFPVLLLMLLSFILESKKDLLFSNVLLSSVVFLNEMVALYVAKPEVIDTIRMTTPHIICSQVCGFFEILCFSYFAYLYIFRNNEKIND